MPLLSESCPSIDGLPAILFSPARTYDVHGEPLAVSCADASLHRAAATVLRHKGIAPIDDRVLGVADGGSQRGKQGKATSANGPNGLHLTIERVARGRPLPDDTGWLGTCVGSDLNVYRCGDTLRIVGSEGQAHVDVDEGIARIELTPSFVVSERRGPTLLFTYLVGFSLVELLKTRGWIPLHAAVLARHNRGLMLLAESDAGKSTTAFQLVRHGWSYVSDDSVLLRATGTGEVEALSLRPHFCLDAAAARHFPELLDHEWPLMVRDEVKWRVDVERLYPGRFFPSCRPRAVVVPAISEAAYSTLVPIEAQTVVPSLLQQSGFRLTAGSERAGQHFQLIGQLLQQCATYRFCGGRDVLEDGHRVHRLFESLTCRDLAGPVPESG